jgi:hypothetical protein
MNIIGGEYNIMHNINSCLKKIFTPFLLITLIFCLSFSIRSGYCGEIKNNKALDEKVKAFLENRKWERPLL